MRCRGPVASYFTASPNTSDYRSDTCTAPPDDIDLSPNPFENVEIKSESADSSFNSRDLNSINFANQSRVDRILSDFGVPSTTMRGGIRKRYPDRRGLSVLPQSTYLDAPPHPRRLHCLRFKRFLPLGTRKAAESFLATRTHPLFFTPPSASPHHLRTVPTTTSTGTSSFRPSPITTSSLNLSMKRLHLLLRLRLFLATPTSTR